MPILAAAKNRHIQKVFNVSEHTQISPLDYHVSWWQFFDEKVQDFILYLT